jgi:hypothetical protein
VRYRARCLSRQAAYQARFIRPIQEFFYGQNDVLNLYKLYAIISSLFNLLPLYQPAQHRLLTVMLDKVILEAIDSIALCFCHTEVLFSSFN